MSWEANIWAVKQRMKLPQEQLVLIVLGNCADPDAIAFSTWPGRDHWWKYLSRITRLSRSSLFRHINTIVSLGLASRTMLVLADGSKRPTITLHLEATFDIEKEEGRYIDATTTRSKDESHSETHDDHVADEAENNTEDNALDAENTASDSESHGETEATLSPTHGTDSVPPAGLHIDSSKSSSKDSPPIPSGGFVRDESWEQFVEAWGDPIPKLALARAGWDRIATDKRPKAIAAAKGYFAWLKAHKKPPAAISAQAFLRDSGGWEQWPRYAPDATGVSPSIYASYAVGSREAKAIEAAYEIAGKSDLFRYRLRDGKVWFDRPLTPRLLGLAGARSREHWERITRQQYAAWGEFLREAIDNKNRREFREGDNAPWPWPPKSDGTIYSGSGPPADGTLMSEEDMHHI